MLLKGERRLLLKQWRGEPSALDFYLFVEEGKVKSSQLEELVASAKKIKTSDNLTSYLFQDSLKGDPVQITVSIR